MRLQMIKTIIIIAIQYDEDFLETDVFVCICTGVTDTEIKQSIADGCRDMASLQAELEVATCCGRCGDMCEKLLSEAHHVHTRPIEIAIQVA